MEPSPPPNPGLFEEPLQRLQGVVERLTFHSPDSGYSVLRLKVPGMEELVTVTGSFADVQPGQSLLLLGHHREHPRYGPQFQMVRYRETRPATLNGIEKYLGSGLIKGVGPVTAKRITGHFGLETLEIIEKDIERLLEVPGIGKARVRMIREAWAAQKAVKEVMLFLQGHGVSTTYAAKIYKRYGDQSITVLTENPYRLADDIHGIGFLTADTIARKLGIDPGSDFRLRAGLLYALSRAGEEGHSFLPEEKLFGLAAELLALEDSQPPPESFPPLLRALAAEGEVVLEADPAPEGAEVPSLLCYKSPFHHAEEALARRLRDLAARPFEVDADRVKDWLRRYGEKTGTDLAEAQKEAVLAASRERVLVLTGGPGCGKTFTTRAIVSLWKSMGRSVALASPTGRAAQRLAEMTGLEAKTLHRLLEFDPKEGGFKRGGDNFLPEAALVVDESSMVDLFLGHSLLKAIRPDGQVLFVGDVDQLPSVGPGKVLKDLVDSGRVAVVRLTHIFRQAEKSAIVLAAHAVNAGRFPRLLPVTLPPPSDCLFLPVPEPEQAADALKALVSDFLPAQGFDAARDLQVLCPMTRGAAGTRQLNIALREMLNPHRPGKAELARGGSLLRTGDRVIQRVNDYDRDVYNGDLGIIEGIDTEDQEVRVRFGAKTVAYDYPDLDEIAPAFAITIHKSQGSEYPVVFIPLFTQHFPMLGRNLLYTGLTRGKKLVVVLGQERALGMAVRQVRNTERYSRLALRLRGLVET